MSILCKIYLAMFMFRFLFCSHECNIGKVQITLMRTLFEVNDTRNSKTPSVTTGTRSKIFNKIVLKNKLVALKKPPIGSA